MEVFLCEEHGLLSNRRMKYTCCQFEWKMNRSTLVHNQKNYLVIFKLKEDNSRIAQIMGGAKVRFILNNN